jgi:hypothetical protein
MQDGDDLNAFNQESEVTGRHSERPRTADCRIRNAVACVCIQIHDASYSVSVQRKREMGVSGAGGRGECREHGRVGAQQTNWRGEGERSRHKSSAGAPTGRGPSGPERRSFAVVLCKFVVREPRAGGGWRQRASPIGPASSGSELGHV